MDLSNIKLDALWDTVLAWSPKVVAGIVVLIIGFWIVNIIAKLIGKSLEKSGIDGDLIPFLKSLVSVLLKILVVITAAGVVGIEITAFAALIAGAGLAIGAAMSGTLSHFAAGVMVLIFKPYKVGDLVDIQGVVGHVDEIQVFNTVINTLENKKVIMPNGIATSGIMTNLSANGKLRVDLNVAMPYEEDFDKVKVLLAVRPYATDETYWDVYFNSYREIKKAFGEAGIDVAYPTRKIKNI